MLTYVIENNNEITKTIPQVIMQKSSVEQMRILAPRYYQEIDMSTFTATMEYIIPSNQDLRKYNMIGLTANTLDYENTDMIEFIVPIGIDLTSESGEVEFQVTFTKVGMDSSGNTVQYVRKTLGNVIKITPINIWDDIVPDERFTAIDQRILALDTKAKQYAEFANTLSTKMVTDIQLDKENRKLQLKSDVSTVGDGVAIRDISEMVKEDVHGEDTDPVVDGVSDLDNTDLG